MAKGARSWLAHGLFVVLGTVIALTSLPAVASGKPARLDLFELAAPSFTTFNTRDGLPDPVSVSIRTDRQGFVWAGTQHGLARYDGRRWHAIDDPKLDGYVDQLFLDHTGMLWASSRTFGLARYDGKRWHLEGAAAGLTTTHLRRLVETERHGGGKTLWAVTWDAGLFYRAQGRWHADPGNAELPHGVLLAAGQTRSLGGHERMWVGTGNQGLWYRQDGGRWQPFHADGFHPSQIEHLFVTRHDGHEALWISAFGSGIWRLDDHGLRHWSVESGELPTNELYNIVETPTPQGGHAIWVASRAGLVRIYHDHVRVFDSSYGLPTNAVRGISSWVSPDGTDVLWLATEAGVARTIVGAHEWKTASLLGSHQIGVFGVLVDTDKRGDERLWVASVGDGLGLYQHGRWRYFNKAGGQLPVSDVYMLARAEDLQGRAALWVGTGMGYLLRVHDGPRFEPVATPWPHDSGQRLSDMLSRRVGGQVEQWFATRSSGVYRRRGGKWTAYRPQGATGQWGVTGLVEQITADGRSWLWASSAQGLARFDGIRWELLGSAAGLPGTNLIGLNLISDAHGHAILWAGSTHHGIIRVDVNDPMHPRVLPPDLPKPPDPNTYDALRDSRGRIYICSNAGVQLLTPASGGYRARNFRRRDGMVNDECNTNAQFIDAHDRYWTGTLGGLTVYDPAQTVPDRHAKPLRLTQVSLDGKPAGGEPVRVPSGHHDLRVEFALLSWQHEGESRFRTELQGFDAGPGSWTADNYRDLGALPGGDYVLRVEARDYAGNVSAPALLPVHVVPEWWQRGWVLALFALVVFMMGYGLLHWRTRALQGRQYLLERRIAERTAELNHANGKLLELSHRDALTGLFNRRRLLQLLQPDADHRGQRVALIFVDVDHFKQYNDAFGHPAGDQALRIVADTMRRCAPEDAVVARYGGEEFACLLFDCDMPTACAIAEHIRAGVAACPVPVPVPGFDDASQRITISAGVASCRLDSSDDMRRLLHDADRALYSAKRDGRNCARRAAA